jgi:hypothetical protein
MKQLQVDVVEGRSERVDAAFLTAVPVGGPWLRRRIEPRGFIGLACFLEE